MSNLSPFGGGWREDWRIIEDSPLEGSWWGVYICWKLSDNVLTPL
jgi:hypothetical protein